MKRKKIIIANWKMNMTNSEAKSFVTNFKKNINTNNCDIVLCTPFVSITTVYEILKNTNVYIGAQNLYFEEKGAFTGEISAKMLKDINVEYVIIGHFERRKYFLETDEIINKKVIKAIEHNIKPIICVGETLEELENNLKFDVIKRQITKSIKNVEKHNIEDIIFAYEPIWSIGTNKAATCDQAEEMCLNIRNILKDIYSEDISNKIRIIYGGSINQKNAFLLFNKNNIDGGLVGNFSLDNNFYKIINEIKE